MANRKYSTPPKPGTQRHRVIELNEKPDAKYALFRRSQSGKSAYFHCVLTSLETGVETAKEYAAESVSAGHTDFTYYVVEIKHRVGIEHGKLVDQANT